MFPDEAARIFSQAFYHALIAPKQTVKDAFEIAVSTVNIKTPAESKIFLLLPSGERGGAKLLRLVFHVRDTTFSFLRRQDAGNFCPLPVLIVMSTYLSGERWLELASAALFDETSRILWKRSVSYEEEVYDRHMLELEVNSCFGECAPVTNCIFLSFTRGGSRGQDLRRPSSGSYRDRDSEVAADVPPSKSAEEVLRRCGTSGDVRMFQVSIILASPLTRDLVLEFAE